MTHSEIVVRPADEGDRAALEKFECSNGAWYEDEVERYIRRRALDDGSRVVGYSLLVAEERDRLLACMSYLLEALEVEEQSMIVTSRLQVLAITRPDQGRVLESGRRLSDALIETLIAKATATSVEGVVTAIVARENLRSLRLCERNGLVSQVVHDARYVRMLGRFGSGVFSLE